MIRAPKTNRGIEQKLVRNLQEAYVSVGVARFEAELARVVTPEDADAFRAKWSHIADQLADGVILDLEGAK